MAPSPEEESRLASSQDDRRAELVFAASVLGALVLVVLLHALVPRIMSLLLISALLSYAVLPLVDYLDRRMPRLLAVLLIALGGVGIVALVVVLLTPYVAAELKQLPEVISRTSTTLGHAWTNLRQSLPSAVTRFIEGVWSSIAGAARGTSPTSARVTEFAGKAAEAVTTFASGIVFVPVFVFLMLRRFHSFTGNLARVVPPRWRERFTYWAGEADVVLSGFVRGHLTVALILALVYGAAFTIIGIPLGLVVGILAGLGELVPFLGGLIAIVLGSLMGLAGGHPIDILWVIGTYFVVQGIESTVIAPWIVGHRAQIGMAAVIIALAIGGELFGLLGMVLAVPVTGLLKVATRAAVSAYQASPFFRARAPA